MFKYSANCIPFSNNPITKVPTPGVTKIAAIFKEALAKLKNCSTLISVHIYPFNEQANPASQFSYPIFLQFYLGSCMQFLKTK